MVRDANATLHVVLRDIEIDTMMPQNSVDAYAFWTVIVIFAVVLGNLVYDSLFRNWGDIFYFEPKCPAPCCEEGDDDE